MSKRSFTNLELTHAVNTAINALCKDKDKKVLHVITLGGCDPLETTHTVTSVTAYPALINKAKTLHDLELKDSKADYGKNGVEKGYFVAVSLDGQTAAVLLLNEPISKEILQGKKNCNLSLVPKHHTEKKTSRKEMTEEVVI